MKKRAAIPLGHAVDYRSVSMAEVKQAFKGIHLKPDVDEAKFLSDLQFTISAYLSDKQADKIRVPEIRKALKGEVSSHSIAAGVWLKAHGGKTKNSYRARMKFNETVAQGRPKTHAKTILAHSLARILSEYTVESVSTSRDNGTALTQNGALATLFHAALKAHGETINDPFPYLQEAVDNLSITPENNSTSNPS